jgi:phytoene desaturase
MMRVVVVGAGLGGLSAAAHLIGADHDVTVIERAAIPGGRAGLVANDLGYRLDNGPTVLTMPELLDDAFVAAASRPDVPRCLPRRQRAARLAWP